MRIGQIAPLAESVPPRLYGGTERVVSWLVEELVDLGHEVTLFASGDSKTRADLVPAWPRATRLERPRLDPFTPIAALLEEVARRADKFDILHCHLDWVHIPLLHHLGIPFLTTVHNRLDLPSLRGLVRSFPDTQFVSISESHRRPLPQLSWLGTVHHGLPADLFRPVPRSNGYLVFLGRIAPEKGPDIAIRLAKAAGLPLRIAAKIPRDESRYFRERVEPFIDDNSVTFVGEVGDREKQELLGGAAALLFPIDWPEPFGLVMIEAMACGTPVIAWRRGSVPEIIEHGVTGFIVDSEAEAVRAIRQLDQLDRSVIRKRFNERFTAKRMAEDYCRLYGKLIAPMRERPKRRENRRIERAPAVHLSPFKHPEGELGTILRSHDLGTSMSNEHD
jgi:glycosyltransferase involved in cell wall biosynthesis